MAKGRRYQVGRIARILVEGDSDGDSAAARKNGVSRKSMENWRAELGTNADLRKAYDALRKQDDDDWHASRRKALDAACKRGTELLQTEKNLDKVTRFIAQTGGLDVSRIIQIGGLEVVRRALGGSDPSDPAGSEPSGSAASDGQEPRERAH